MATDLTPQQRQAIDAARGAPVDVVDPQTNEHYILMRAAMYERLKGVFDDGPLTEAERTGLLREAGKRAGWDDPAMNVYDDLDPRKP